MAPLGLRERIIELIEREVRNAGAGRAARIVVKMNALVEPSVIDALYRASQGGVPIHLIVRGICCLRPGLPGVSDTIRVTSIVDRFLEHSRVFYFENAGDPEVLLASADWMPRNFRRRIEDRIVNEVLALSRADNVKARELRADGTYERRAPREGKSVVRSQIALQNLAREAARDGGGARPPFKPVTRRPRAPGSRAEPSSPVPERARKPH